VREANAANVEKELQLRQKELRDLADAAANDRRYAADELAKAQEAADEIVADADGKAAAAETKAKGALQQHAYISKLEKTKLILNKRIPHRT
jgi:hypothetical protein